MSAMLIAVAHVFRDFGVTNYIKRVKNLDDSTIRTARTLLMSTSGGMALLMYLSAEMWATFFGDTRVQEVVEVLALGFLLIPFGAIATAILSRELQVAKTALTTLIAASIYFIVSISMALNGFEHMTMAWANLINIFCTGLLANIFLGNRLPWKPSLQGWRRMTNFGVGNVTTNLTKALNTALPDMALGYLSTPTAVGLFSRAQGTVTMTEKLLEPPVNYFTLPQMAKLHHAEGDLNAVLIRVASIVQCVMFPALAWIAIVAPQLIEFLYGEQWVTASTAVPWLCVAIAISSSSTLATPTLMGVGRPYAPLTPLALILIAKIGAIALLFDGTLVNFAFAIAAGEIIGLPAYLWVLSRYAQLRIQSWLRLNFLQLLYLLPVNGLLWMLAAYVVTEWPAWIALLVTAVTTAAVHAILFLTVDLPIREELRILIKNIQHLRRSRTHSDH